MQNCAKDKHEWRGYKAHACVGCKKRHRHHKRALAEGGYKVGAIRVAEGLGF